MKSKEELEVLKKECQELNRKFAELSEEEIKEVTGGMFFKNSLPELDSAMKLINTPSPITHLPNQQMDGTKHYFECAKCDREFITTANPPYYCPICGSRC